MSFPKDRPRRLRVKTPQPLCWLINHKKQLEIRPNNGIFEANIGVGDYVIFNQDSRTLAKIVAVRTYDMLSEEEWASQCITRMLDEEIKRDDEAMYKIAPGYTREQIERFLNQLWQELNGLIVYELEFVI